MRGSGSPRRRPEQAALTAAFVCHAGKRAFGLLHDLCRQAKPEPAPQVSLDAFRDVALGWLGREIEVLRFTVGP